MSWRWWQVVLALLLRFVTLSSSLVNVHQKQQQQQRQRRQSPSLRRLRTSDPSIAIAIPWQTTNSDAEDKTDEQLDPPQQVQQTKNCWDWIGMGPCQDDLGRSYQACGRIIIDEGVTACVETAQAWTWAVGLEFYPDSGACRILFQNLPAADIENADLYCATQLGDDSWRTALVIDQSQGRPSQVGTYSSNQMCFACLYEEASPVEDGEDTPEEDPLAEPSEDDAEQEEPPVDMPPVDDEPEAPTQGVSNSDDESSTSDDGDAPSTGESEQPPDDSGEPDSPPQEDSVEFFPSVLAWDCSQFVGRGLCLDDGGRLYTNKCRPPSSFRGNSDDCRDTAESLEGRYNVWGLQYFSFYGVPSCQLLVDPAACESLGWISDDDDDDDDVQGRGPPASTQFQILYRCFQCVSTARDVTVPPAENSIAVSVPTPVPSSQPRVCDTSIGPGYCLDANRNWFQGCSLPAPDFEACQLAAEAYPEVVGFTFEQYISVSCRLWIDQDASCDTLGSGPAGPGHQGYPVNFSMMRYNRCYSCQPVPTVAPTPVPTVAPTPLPSPAPLERRQCSRFGGGNCLDRNFESFQECRKSIPDVETCQWLAEGYAEVVGFEFMNYHGQVACRLLIDRGASCDSLGTGRAGPGAQGYPVNLVAMPYTACYVCESETPSLPSPSPTPLPTELPTPSPTASPTALPTSLQPTPSPTSSIGLELNGHSSFLDCSANVGSGLCRDPQVRAFPACQSPNTTTTLHDCVRQVESLGDSRIVGVQFHSWETELQCLALLNDTEVAERLCGYWKWTDVPAETIEAGRGSPTGVVQHPFVNCQLCRATDGEATTPPPTEAPKDCSKRLGSGSCKDSNGQYFPSCNIGYLTHENCQAAAEAYPQVVGFNYNTWHSVTTNCNLLVNGGVSCDALDRGSSADQELVFPSQTEYSPFTVCHTCQT